MPFVALLFGLLFFCIIAGLTYWFWQKLPVGEPIKSYILCFLILVLIAAVIYYWPMWIGQFAGRR